MSTPRSLKPLQHTHRRQIGRALVSAGCRVATGGRGGVMAAALRGAASSPSYADGDTLAILPGSDPSDACPHASIVIPTGLGHYRNGVVAAADAVIAVGGGAGTVSEVALAWLWGRAPVVVVTGLPGAAAALVGASLGPRRGPAGEPAGGGGGRAEGVGGEAVLGAANAEEAVRMLVARLAATGTWPALAAAAARERGPG